MLYHDIVMVSYEVIFLISVIFVCRIFPINYTYPGKFHIIIHSRLFYVTFWHKRIRYHYCLPELPDLDCRNGNKKYGYTMGWL